MVSLNTGRSWRIWCKFKSDWQLVACWQRYTPHSWTKVSNCNKKSWQLIKTICGAWGGKHLCTLELNWLSFLMTFYHFITIFVALFSCYPCYKLSIWCSQYFWDFWASFGQLILPNSLLIWQLTKFMACVGNVAICYFSTVGTMAHLSSTVGDTVYMYFSFVNVKWAFLCCC